MGDEVKGILQNIDNRMSRQYIAIDLKSFYASVECIDRDLNPLTTNLVVADIERTEKTICLAVTPALKAYGIPGRARLFEVVEKVRQVNAERKYRLRGRDFSGSSCDANELSKDNSLEISYHVAPPRMGRYMEVSTGIYQIYLKYVAPEDIHVYSIDEVFMDVTSYLNTYRMTAEELAKKIILDVMKTTGITATAGIGPNLYLCKIAMDIEAKHIPADENGVRIAKLDEQSYRRKLWDHRPLTDFWRVGKGYADRLEKIGVFTMGDIAALSVSDEEILYKMFGVNAELLIDHAWGYEPCTIADIKAYRPESNSISSGQVLQHPYTFEKARLVIREMADSVALDLVDKGLVTDQMELTVGYDISNMTSSGTGVSYAGEVKEDRYGRKVPKAAHGSIRLSRKTSSSRMIMEAVTELYEKIVDPALSVRRMYVVANRIIPKEQADEDNVPEQLDLFTDYEALEREKKEEDRKLEKERSMQQAMLDLKKKFGKNAVLKGMNLEDGATGRMRNGQIGGHRE